MRRSLLSLLALCAVLAPPSGAAAAADAAGPPPAASFFATPAVSLVELSPGGGHVALVRTGADGVQTLEVRDTAHPEQARVIASASGQERYSALHWISEQRLGYSVRNLDPGHDGSWDEYAADHDGANRRQLIAGGWRARGPGVLGADYAWFGATHDGSDDILVQRYSWNADRTPAASRLYRLDTRDGRLRPLLEGPQPASLDWLTDASDRPRLASTVVQGRCITHYRAADAGSWREIANTPCFQAARFEPRFFDGDDLLFVSSPYEGRAALFRYSLKAMKRETEPYLDLPGFDIEGTPVTDPGSRRVLGMRIETDTRTTHWFHAGMRDIQARLDALLPQASNLIQCPADCVRAPALLVESSSDRQPTQYLLYRPASGALLPLGASRPAVDAQAMGRRLFAYYRARDGLPIPAYVTRPAGAPEAPLAAVVLVHGGPHVRGASWEWEAQAQFLASRGYLVIEPEFRGSTGFGANHFQAGLKQWGLAMQDDLADAARWAIAQGWADPARIAIMGSSYGGYASLMGLIANPELFRCGVEWSGVADIGLKFSAAGADTSEEYLNYSARTLIGDPQADAARFRRTSPLLRAAELKQPLLMAHGAADRRVPVEHAARLRDALLAQGAQVSAIIYPDEGHGWRHDRNSIDFWTRVEAFLERNL